MNELTAIRAALKESGAGFICLMEEEWKEAGTGLYMVVNVSASIALEVGKMSLIEGLVVYDFSSA